MLKLEKTIEKIKAINYDDIINEILNLQKIKDRILILNKSQLWDGLTNEGKNIRPSYLEDDFFPTMLQRENYARWKDNITSNPERDFYTPNLFIDGTFYRSIKILGSDTELTIFSDSNLGAEVTNKFKNILGLNEDSFNSLRKTLLSLFIIKIKDEIL